MYLNPWTPYLSKVALKVSFRLPILYKKASILFLEEKNFQNSRKNLDPRFSPV